ncbi:hypothetical protein Goari_008445, partial [Gossypium aridum]|nr:hypothetical protein [Gossypium aridum]
MQAAAIVAMVVHAILTITPSHPTLLHALSSPNPSDPQVLQSTFRGISLNLPRPSLSIAATVPKKQFSVLAVSKKAVAVLKGDSKVEGVVTLTQEDDGLFSFQSLCLYLFSNASC